MFALTCFIDSVGWVFYVFVPADMLAKTIFDMASFLDESCQGLHEIDSEAADSLSTKLVEHRLSRFGNVFSAWKRLSLIACIDTRTWVFFDSRV